ncbi:MAG: succinyl-diaminopimelate desuccinylase [Zetaproteobacteria bacterium]|nr:succinyl-diaminopimelate desuccinylase [Zetaproteobacteria bacterium]
MHHVTDLAIELLRRASLTPDDAGCQDWMEKTLAPFGFIRTHIDIGGVTNSIFFRPGEKPGTLAFAGHTDVVPTGPLTRWSFDPFSAHTDDNNILHGRGAQDMKGAIAAWMQALMHLIQRGEPLPAMQLLITSDEEGESIDGTIRIVEYLEKKQWLPNAVIVGEPSCAKEVGDTIRRGRRGVVQAHILFHGKQGHSAYPADADNAIHHAMPALDRIANIHWGEPADGFPPTSCQITNVKGGTGATNIIPGQCEAWVDIRYNPSISFEQISTLLHACCGDTNATLNINHVAEAFSTPSGPFIEHVAHAIAAVTGIKTLRDTGGGTSDGRFLAKAGIAVVELGLTNRTIHQINEQVAIDELITLTQIYIHIIQHFEA